MPKEKKPYKGKKKKRAKKNVFSAIDRAKQIRKRRQQISKIK